MKIPGLLAPAALEMDNKPYYPIADVQGTIRMLIDPATSKVCLENSCDPFGVGLTSEIPYAYGGKRYDAGSGLIYFGKRYYVPALGRWLTPDPIGPVDHSNLYAPDRPLPTTPDGIPLPETDAPHTELGARDGRKGKYPQAREFDEHGNPVRDIDFTDHGTPHKHPNPHQHRREDNPTGGSRSREDAEPLPGWKY